MPNARLGIAIGLLVAFIALLSPSFLHLPFSPIHWTSRNPLDSITSVASDSAKSASSSIKSSTMASSIRRAAPVILPAVTKHTATVIFIHGLGDTGHGWSDAVEHWRRKQRMDEVKFILPHAPQIPITMNGGFQMPGWFDIKSLGPAIDSLKADDSQDDAAGIQLSCAYFHSLIQDEISAGISSERIVLGGFSQGGAMSIFAGLTAPVKIAGIVGLSSWLLLNQTFKDRVPEANLNKATPIFMGHGDRDAMVRHALAQASQKKLTDLGYDATFNTYRGMEHSACLEELDDVEAFIVSRLTTK